MLAQVLNGDIDDLPNNRGVYIVRDEDVVFFVGKTEIGLVKRMLKDVGMLAREPDPVRDRLRRLVADNAPESGNWQVDYLTVKNCEPYVRQHFPNQKMLDVDLAELAIIKHFRPLLNSNNAEQAGELPARYVKGTP